MAGQSSRLPIGMKEDSDSEFLCVRRVLMEYGLGKCF
jgi:hypothetical protein